MPLHPSRRTERLAVEVAGRQVFVGFLLHGDWSLSHESGISHLEEILRVGQHSKIQRKIDLYRASVVPSPLHLHFIEVPQENTGTFACCFITKEEQRNELVLDIPEGNNVVSEWCSDGFVITARGQLLDDLRALYKAILEKDLAVFFDTQCDPAALAVLIASRVYLLASTSERWKDFLPIQ